jgi:asparagine synthase (glutamine-hydrolysing)
MASSLEVRCPLLDHELMELAARLPEREKRRGSRGKLALREALRPWLPASVLDRPKMGFSVPIADWMRGELQRLPGDVLLDRRARERGLFRAGAVERMIAEHTGGTRDHAQRLWTLIGLELWLRTYIDGPVPAPVTAG